MDRSRRSDSRSPRRVLFADDLEASAGPSSSHSASSKADYYRSKREQAAIRLAVHQRETQLERSMRSPVLHVPPSLHSSFVATQSSSPSRSTRSPADATYAELALLRAENARLRVQLRQKDDDLDRMRDTVEQVVRQRYDCRPHNTSPFLYATCCRPLQLGWIEQLRRERS